MHTYICKRRTFKRNFSSNDKGQGTYFQKEQNESRVETVQKGNRSNPCKINK